MQIAELEKQLKGIANALQTCNALDVRYDVDKLQLYHAETLKALNIAHVQAGLVPKQNMDALEYQCRADLELIAATAINGLLHHVYTDPSINLQVALAQKILSAVH